jgi:inosine-uridine nucleoside N-ribohydrolase
VVGLNVTTQVKVKPEDLVGLAGSPFGEYLAAMTSQYFRIRGRDFTHMHDPLAVASVFDPSVVTTRRMSAEALEDGRAAYTSDERGHLDVCTAVDAPAFETLLTSRVRALCAQSQISNLRSKGEM